MPESGSTLSHYGNTIATQLARIGEMCSHKRPQPGELNRFNKPDDDSFVEVGEGVVAALLVRPSISNDAETARTTTGYVNREEPVLLFPDHADVQMDDRVEYLGVTYELEAPMTYPTHIETPVRKVQEDDPDVTDGPN